MLPRCHVRKERNKVYWLFRPNLACGGFTFETWNDTTAGSKNEALAGIVSSVGRITGFSMCDVCFCMKINLFVLQCDSLGAPITHAKM